MAYIIPRILFYLTDLKPCKSQVKSEVASDEGLCGVGALVRGGIPVPLLLIHGAAVDHRRDDGGRLPRPRRVLCRHLPQRLSERRESELERS